MKQTQDFNPFEHVKAKIKVAPKCGYYGFAYYRDKRFDDNWWESGFTNNGVWRPTPKWAAKAAIAKHIRKLSKRYSKSAMYQRRKLKAIKVRMQSKEILDDRVDK